MGALVAPVDYRSLLETGRRYATATISAAPDTSTVIDCGGLSTVGLQLNGTYTGLSGTFEESFDGGVTWVTAHTFMVFDLNGSSYLVSFNALTLNKLYIVSVAHITHLRLNISAIASGSVTIDVIGKVSSFPLLGNNNSNLTALASAVRAATLSSADLSNYFARGLTAILDITAVPGVTTVTLTVEGKDPVSNKYYTIFSGAAEVAVATRVYRIYPGLTAVANVDASGIIPRTFRVTVTHSGAGNFTYSVGIQLEV